MKHILILFALLINSLFLFGQNLNIDETIEYINDKLYKYDWQTYMVMNSQVSDEYKIDSYDKFSVSENGKLFITRYAVKKGKIIEGGIQEMYLKEIDSTKIVINYSQEADSYRIEICCKEWGCVYATYFDVTQPCAKVSVNNYDVAKKIRNAIKYLIKLAYEEEKFYEKDPFD